MLGTARAALSARRVGQERRLEAENARKMEEWRKQRENLRQEMAAEVRGAATEASVGEG